MVYSVLPGAEWMLLFGIIYFLTGAFIYKYQLLYAMDHRHFSTGRAWVMICNRITVGLLVFQVTMACQLAFKTAIRRSLIILPLLAATGWFIIVYRRTYEPLMRFIALRSLRDAQAPPGEPRLAEEVLSIGASDRSRNDTELNTSYVNPSLVMPLEDVWLSKRHAREASISNGEGDVEVEAGDV